MYFYVSSIVNKCVYCYLTKFEFIHFPNTVNCRYTSSFAFWRVDNSLGTFLPAEPTTLRLLARPYELRHVIIGSPEVYPGASRSSEIQASPSGHVNNRQSESSAVGNSGRRFEAVASFRLVWWNRGSSSRKQLSIWRPVVPNGMVYFGDIAVQGYVVLYNNFFP